MSAETLYSFRDAYPTVLERDRQQVVRMEVYRDGALVAPTESGSTYSLFDPNNNAVVDGASVTVTSSVATYTIPAASLPSTLDLGEGYREEWTLVLPDGTTRTVRREAALARRALYPVVTDEDLDAEYPNMARYTPDSGTWQRFIDEAWKRIINRLVKDGTLSYLIMSPTAFRGPHRELANALRFKDLHAKSGGQESRWLDLYNTHIANYGREWGELNFLLDEDHDGVPDADERHGSGTTVHVNSAPHRYTSRSRWW